MKTTILVLHYADDDTTTVCVDSLLRQLPGGARLVVVDDGSPLPYVNPSVEVMRLDTNVFMIPAFAAAMRAFPADVYGLLNNDLICHVDMTKTVLACFNDPNVGIVAPGSSDRGTGILYVDGPGKHGNVEAAHVDNHCFWISQALVDEIGYPEVEGHTNLYCWSWNKFYCWQARQAGFKVVAARNAYVEHLHRGGYNAEADQAGQAWLKQRLGDRWQEAQ